MSVFVLWECEDHCFPVVQVPNPYDPARNDWRHLLSNGKLSVACISTRKQVDVRTT